MTNNFLRECAFGDVKDFLPEGSLLVANNTKVVHARLEMGKASTGKITVLRIARTGTSISLGREADSLGSVGFSKDIGHQG